jgi:DNA-binding NarL/FixJ family response regulator
MARGWSIPEIARDFGISRRTVEFHISQIFYKLGACSRSEATRIIRTAEPL